MGNRFDVWIGYPGRDGRGDDDRLWKSKADRCRQHRQMRCVAELAYVIRMQVVVIPACGGCEGERKDNSQRDEENQPVLGTQ